MKKCKRQQLKIGFGFSNHITCIKCQNWRYFVVACKYECERKQNGINSEKIFKK